MKNIEFILKLFPLLSVLIIISGTLNQMIYYGLFGINILNFIDLTEIITIYIEQSILLMLFILFFFLCAAIYFKFSDKMSQKKHNIIIPLILLFLYLSFTILLSLFIQSFLVYSIVSVFLIILTIYNDFFHGEHFFSLFNYKTYDEKKILTATKLSFIILFCTSLYTATVKYLQYNSKPNTYVSVTLQNEKKIDNKKEYYIGNTKNYIFIYNDSLNEAYSLSMSQVLKINFKKKDFFKTLFFQK